jgi:hypothetical protein
LPDFFAALEAGGLGLERFAAAFLAMVDDSGKTR